MIREIRSGNLLEAEAEVLVNPVNTDGIMGAGLAAAFKATYPEMFREYATVCRRGMLDVGSLHFWLTGLAVPRLVANFPTKKSWRDTSRTAWIDAGLRELVVQLEARNVSSVAIPALGCGLGGLSWPEVRKRVYRAMRLVPYIDVQLYGPQPKRVRTKR
jgi:O-acetyl-ADP-ribose deacetylase (regulator of RNase III)